MEFLRLAEGGLVPCARRAHRITLLSLICWLLLALAVPVLAEEGAAAEGPMDAVAGMVGTWTGEGWIRMGPGEPIPFDSKETVESRLGGQALVVEGEHHAKSDGRLVHHAVALLSHDAEAGVYRFRTHVAGRGPGDFEGRVEDGAFVWGGAAGPGKMRYTIRIDGDTWHEVGEFSRDGETWNSFFQMDLKRTGS